ncbi:hypothetical protein FB599_0379 [Herbaspirillum sp. SJZ130]|nr:hypothetical protein FB599_0379 [Herbaspirillum sp. SJZ130]TQK14976.1 hypothetical protein FB598_0317 [Herbaspirillum sp. SJZ106]TWC67331.1 hypothetical protein FB597_104141 [Herbaspirillum sp. SJZ099]
MLSEDLEQWLQGLPLGEPFDIGGESVYLQVGDGGAELGVILVREPTDAQITESMRCGFQCALEFEAGLAIPDDGDALVLNRWLPDAETWADAADALENILNQAGLWRAAMKPSNGRQAEDSSRAEQRLRTALNGGAA